MKELEKDVRLLQRNIAKGFLSRSAVDKVLSELPDVESQGVWVDMDTIGQDDEPAAAAPAAE